MIVPKLTMVSRVRSSVPFIEEKVQRQLDRSVAEVESTLMQKATGYGLPSTSVPTLHE